MLSQSDDVTRTQPHVVFHGFAVPRDSGVFARGEHDGAANTVAVEGAVARKDVISKEEDVNTRLVFVITASADENVWCS